MYTFMWEQFKSVILNFVGKAEMMLGHCPSLENSWYRKPLLLMLYLSLRYVGAEKRLRSIRLNDFLFVLKYNYGMSLNSGRIYC